jgi:hypothetical protein
MIVVAFPLNDGVRRLCIAEHDDGLEAWERGVVMLSFAFASVDGLQWISNVS